MRVAFPYGSGSIGGAGSDWTKGSAHTTTLTESTPTSARFKRMLDFDEYEVLLCRRGQLTGMGI